MCCETGSTELRGRTLDLPGAEPDSSATGFGRPVESDS